ARTLGGAGQDFRHGTAIRERHLQTACYRQGTARLHRVGARVYASETPGYCRPQALQRSGGLHVGVSATVLGRDLLLQFAPGGGRGGLADNRGVPCLPCRFLSISGGGASV